MKLQCTGFDLTAQRYEAAARTLQEEALVKDALFVALEPTAERWREYVQKKTGKTAADIAVREEVAALGEVAMSIGGRIGKGGRAHILQWLEFGLPARKPPMRAFPSARPAYDATKDGIVPRFTAKLRASLGLG